MKKILQSKISNLAISGALIACALPLSASAQSITPLFITNKICSVKYQAEVTAINKLINVKKADAKLLEIKSIRKEEDKNIKDIFIKIDEKIEDQDKKGLIDEKKELVLKAIADRREKTDELQSNIRISKSEVQNIVKTTLIEISTTENTKTCPVRSDNSKEIRLENIQKLKKLASDKKEVYQKKTKEIQDDFSIDLRNALQELSSEIVK